MFPALLWRNELLHLVAEEYHANLVVVQYCRKSQCSCNFGHNITLQLSDRTKLTAARNIHEPFVVINGDDFYGRESFRIASDWCRQHENTRNSYAIVGFQLDHTLSESGGVSRGICHYDAEGHLTDVVEHHNVMVEPDGVLRGDNAVSGEHVQISKTDLCSMNMWCFTPDYFLHGDAILVDFLKENINELKKELYIPYVVDTLIKAGKSSCDVLSTPAHWFGVTFKEDRPAVVAKFQELADNNTYPSPLYEK